MTLDLEEKRSRVISLSVYAPKGALFYYLEKAVVTLMLKASEK